MVTDKQEFRLKHEGYTDEQISKMSFEDASEIIGKLPAYKKTIKAPQVETIVSKPPFQSKSEFNPTSSYVSYCKDLCIASLEAATKREKEIELDKLMELAIHCIQMAKNEFSK